MMIEKRLNLLIEEFNEIYDQLEEMQEKLIKIKEDHIYIYGNKKPKEE